MTEETKWGYNWDGVMYIICATAMTPVVAMPLTRITKCDAGCGRSVIHNVRVPDSIPKVCIPCSHWINNCQGEA